MSTLSVPAYLVFTVLSHQHQLTSASDQSVFPHIFAAQPAPSGLTNATATCSEGKGSCSENADKNWCAEQLKKCMVPPEDSCTPKCTWTCGKRECDQVCAPKCNPAVCSTRCKGFNTDTCKMKCQQPQCQVICPKNGCPKGNCAACRTECGKPVCQMECLKEEQPCHQVCAQPLCTWECSKPQVCPLPDCKLTCEKPSCNKQTPIVQALPPLEPGETEVTSSLTMAANASNQSSLLRLRSSVRMHTNTVRVNITSMGQDKSLHTKEVSLQVAAKDEDMEAQSNWVVMAKTRDGKTSSLSASCSHGAFKCDGDGSWCALQRTRLFCQ